MPWVRLPNGMTAHIRVAERPRKRCTGTEGSYPCPVAATRQCDFHIGVGKTCDAWICDAHATSAGPDLDHCPTHAGKQAGLFTSMLKAQ